MKQILRFGMVGAVNTAFSFSLYVLLLWFGLHFALANLGATILGVLFSFRTQGRFVFGDTRWRRLLRFVPVWVGLYGFNVALIAILLRSGLNPYQAGALAVVPTVALSYFIQKHFVFEAPHARRPVESP